MHPLDLPHTISGAHATMRGELSPNHRFGKIERDARNVQTGDLFIAIRGEQFDGHQFVADAARNGAAAALVSRAWSEANPDATLPLLIVEDDPVAGLQRLAAWWRRQINVVVTGITGSIGKTSAKAVTAAILGRRFRTYANPGNLNNEIGLPLSLLEVTPETEMAVLEMGGAYAFGDLVLLAGIALPRVGVEINVHPVHLERMGTIENIAKSKAELIEALPADGVAVLNGDNPWTQAMANLAPGRVITYGLDPGNDLRGKDVQNLGAAGVRFTLDIDGRQYPVETPMLGDHVPMLALSGLAAGYAHGMSPEEMIPALADRAIQVRLQFVPGPNGSQLIDDTYNASTPSMLSALGVLASIPAKRRVGVLGDMREMGDISRREHEIVGRRVAEVADLLVTYGEEARVIAETVNAGSGRIDGASPRVTSFGPREQAALVAWLLEELGDGDVVLLKGSRGLRMEAVVDALRTARLSQEAANAS